MSTPIEVPPDEPPRLVVLIDVEEEFDWRGEFDRNAITVTHVRELVSGLAVFEPFGIVPTGVLTYPVVVHPDAGPLLRQAAQDGKMILGAHLHPWVTPPYEEAVNRHNSFPGNLPPELEAAKLKTLTDAMEDTFGERPRIYQAGRYGLGPNSARILEEQGYLVSMTVNPPFDYSAEGGPDFSRSGNHPCVFGERRKLLELPVTGAFIGFAGSWSTALYRLAIRGPLRALHLPGILARLGAVERIRLSPEGQSPGDLMRLTRALYRQGTRIFQLSFHSPTLKPGCTSYVRNERELTDFLDTCRTYFEFFLGELNGQPATPLSIHSWLLESHTSSRPHGPPSTP
ncbi:MAG: polysaccharide deacetylase family protein [Planctomycetota bacterium]